MGICEAMAELGHDVTLHIRPGDELTPDDHAFYGVKPNFRIEKHPRPQVRGWGAIVNAVHVGRHIRTRSFPDLVYAREQYGLACTVGTGVPFVFEAHWRPRYRLQRETEAWLYRQPNFRRLVVISHGLRRIYRELFPWLPEERVVVAHDAANPPRHAVSSDAPRASTRLQVGYVGGMLPGYGIEVIVAVARANPDVDVHIVGGKEDSIRMWRARTRDVANLTLHGFVPPEHLPAHYANFDVMMAPFQRSTPSIEWISPMKLFEYMAYEKAIVCADFPIMREILSDGETALLVPADDISAWSDAIRRLKTESLRRELGSAALRRLQATHTWRRRAETVLADLS